MTITIHNIIPNKPILGTVITSLAVQFELHRPFVPFLSMDVVVLLGCPFPALAVYGNQVTVITECSGLLIRAIDFVCPASLNSDLVDTKLCIVIVVGCCIIY